MSDVASLADTSASPASASATTSTVAGNGTSPDPASLKKAATQFEAIFLRQMLAAARKTNFDDKLFSGQGLDTFREQMDSRFADTAAQRDALGLAKLIEQRLTRQGTASTPSSAATGASATPSSATSGASATSATKG